jgi:hypothetical protein
MREKKKTELSEMGKAFLEDPITYKALCLISKKVDSTPEEYLMRFERVLKSNPKKLFAVFEHLA